MHFHGGISGHLVQALHFRDEKTEVQRREVTCTNSQSQEVVELEG